MTDEPAFDPQHRGDDFASPRRGGSVRRNALQAAAWAKLTDVDPRVADALLESLEEAGIAAYAEPLAGESGISREVRIPATPTDRLYVDTARFEMAEAIVAAELPGLLEELRPLDEDAAFAAIVAAWNTEAASPVPPWPVEEDVEGSRTRPAEEERPRLRPNMEVDEEDAAPVYEDEGHFVPPPPPPLPRAHPITVWGAFAVVAGVFLIIFLPILGTQPSPAVQVLGVLAIVGGIATLVWRMRDAPPVDDGPDDGAVV